MSKKSVATKPTQSANQTNKSNTGLQNVLVDDFDINNYSVSPIDLDTDFASGGSQYTAFPRYKYPSTGKQPTGGKSKSDSGRLILITDPIKMSKGGLPKVDGNWRKGEGACQFFWLPLLADDLAGQALLNVLTQIDEVNNQKLNVEGNKSGFLKTVKAGKETKLQKIKYSGCVKEFDPSALNVDEDADDGEEDGEEQEQPINKKGSGEKYNRTKVRLKTVWDKNITDKDTEKVVDMKVYINDGNGNPKATAEPVSTMEELRKLFTYNSTIQFAIELNKIWVMKNVDGETKVRKCGLGLKCLQIYVSEMAEYSAVSTELGAGVFGFRGGKRSQNNDEDEVEQEAGEVGEDEVDDVEVEDGDGDGEDEEADEDEDAEEDVEEDAEEDAEADAEDVEEDVEDEPEPEPVKTKGGKKAQAVPAPAPVQAKGGKSGKKVPEPEPEPEDDDEEDPEPVKPIKKPASGVKKPTAAKK